MIFTPYLLRTCQYHAMKMYFVILSVKKITNCGGRSVVEKQF